VESSCEFGNETSGSIKCWGLSSGLTTGELSGSPQLYIVNLVSIWKKEKFLHWICINE
jgi:hypothetical protein